MLNNLVAGLLVALGLGFVIFIHELGHFLVAKWNGVKVEKFSIGFGPAILKWKRGETEYILACIPLGGYVKMLGENPGEDAAKAAADPRAYPNKPVWSRMAIISAGVIMNFLFGWVCNAYIYLRGTVEVPAVIGGVIAGAPAYDAGLRPGDQIVAIEGRRGVNYDDLKRATVFSAAGQVVHLDVKRPGEANLVRIGVEPRTRKSDDAPTIGVIPANSLELDGPPTGPLADKLKRGDKLVSIGVTGSEPIPIETDAALLDFLCRHRAEPLVATFAIAHKDKPGVFEGEVRVEIPPVPLVALGLRLMPGPVAAVQPGSPAEKAGLRVGDRVLAVNGDRRYDVLRLPDFAYNQALEQRSLQLEVERPTSDGSTQTQSLDLTPLLNPIWVERTAETEPLEVAPLGFALVVLPKVQDVIPGSPAERAGIKPGETIQDVTLTRPDNKPRTFKFDESASSWSHVLEILQLDPDRPVQLTLASSPNTLEITPAPVPGWYNPMRGLSFFPRTEPLPPQNLIAALGRGWRDSVDVVGSLYATIRGLFQQRLSSNSFGGPVRIAREAYRYAREAPDMFIPFLGLLSINLAVINFLPIPPLDGGQLVFLIAEKLRGKPLPESPVIVATLAGLTMLLLLIAFTFWNDIRNVFF
jgi:regulator of sigma E protease